MTRWLVLAISFLLWAGMMCLIYREYGPLPADEQFLSGREMLNTLFSPEVSEREGWRVFFDPYGPAGIENLGPAERARREELLAAAGVAGAEPGEIEVGTLLVRILGRGSGKIKVRNDLDLLLPPDSAPFFRMLGRIRHISDTTYDLEGGLEDLDLRIVTAQGDAVVHGIRIGERLQLTLGVTIQGEDLPQMRLEWKLPRGAALQMGFSPFQPRTSLQLGDRWRIPVAQLDHPGGELQMSSLELRVTDYRLIRHLGKLQHAAHVEARRGLDLIAADYSLRGEVLRVHGKLGCLPSLTLVRDDRVLPQTPRRDATPAPAPPP